MAFIPVCRLCQKTWNDATGCDVCGPAKKHSYLVEQSVELESALQRTYNLLVKMIERLEVSTSPPKDEAGKESYFDRFPEYDAKHAKWVSQLTGDVVKFAREFRGFLKQSSAHTQKLSHDEQAKLMTDYFATWPERLQRVFIQAITRFYNERKYGAAGAAGDSDA